MQFSVGTNKKPKQTVSCGSLFSTQDEMIGSAVTFGVGQAVSNLVGIVCWSVVQAPVTTKFRSAVILNITVRSG